MGGASCVSRAPPGLRRVGGLPRSSVGRDVRSFDEDPSAAALAAELRTAGVEVRSTVPYDEMVRLIHQARAVYVPCTIDGGGERAVLEARAAGVGVVIEVGGRQGLRKRLAAWERARGGAGRRSYE